LVDAAHSVYEVPLLIRKQGLHDSLVQCLGLAPAECPMNDWELMLRHIKNPKGTLRVALVGKYINHQDAYKSVTEAIDHAGYANRLHIDLVRIESDALEKDANWRQRFDGINAVVVPGGFGRRGFEGMLMAIEHCRSNGIPFLGLCLGMQAASIEFARNVLGLEGASSYEMDDKTPHPIIVLMDEQKEVVQMGGTMRLGSYPCTLMRKTSRTSKVYGGAEVVEERHRHRFEFNNAYRKDFEKAGLYFTGLYLSDPEDKESSLVEIIEIKDHPYFLATQAHPEFKSSAVAPHPLFKGLVSAAWKVHQS
jgi:CTP synthase